MVSTAASSTTSFSKAGTTFYVCTLKFSLLVIARLPMARSRDSFSIRFMQAPVQCRSFESLCPGDMLILLARSHDPSSVMLVQEGASHPHAQET